MDPHGATPGTRSNIKPWILRSPALVILLFITLIFIGLIEYAFQKLPAADGWGQIQNTLGMAQVVRLQTVTESASTFTTTVQGVVQTLIVTFTPPTASSCPPKSTCAPPSGAWLPVGTITLTSPKSIGTPTSTSPIPATPTPVAVIPAQPASQTPVAPSSSVVPANNPPVASTPPLSSPIVGGNTGNGGSTPVTTIILSAPPSSSYLPVGTTTITSKKVSSSTSQHPATTSAPAPENYLPVQNQPALVAVFTNAQYFSGAFLSTILAVLFALPWVIIDMQVKSLEPFHQLSSPGGSSARKSLFMDYSSRTFIIAPFKALFAGHWAPFITSVLSICTLIITPLAPEFVSIRVEGVCADGCIPSLSIFPLAGRILQALLAFMAILTIILIFIMWRYTTGVFAEPNSIAGLASLFHHPDVVQDFRNAAVTLSGAGEKVYKPLLQEQYRLDYYTLPNGSVRYGFIPSAPRLGFNHQAERNHFLSHDNSAVQPLPTTYPHRKSSVGLLAVLLALLAVIVYYKVKTFDESGFEKFMDSEGFGVRFLFTLVGVIIARYWAIIFRDLATMKAYSNLSLLSSKASNSILLPKLLDPLTSIVPAILRGHLFTALVASSAFLAEVLTITLSNIPFKKSNTFTAFTVSTWLSCGILVVMEFTLMAITFHRQPRLPFKPEMPGSVLYFLADSSLPERFEGMADWEGKLRNKRVRDMDLRYGLWNKNDGSSTSGRAIIDVDI